MSRGAKQRFKLSFLREILLEETDSEHSITMPKIIEKLQKRGVSAERKAIYNDIADMEELGVTVKGTKDHFNYYYHVEKREFSLAELKLLVDAIQSSRFITERKSKELIKKLEKFVSKYERQKLQRQVVVHGRVKTLNESIYQNVDAIHTAIAGNNQLQFKYLKWDVSKKLVEKNNSAWYIVSPWAMIYDDDNYYMIGYDHKDKKIKHYRADKMAKIAVLDDEREGKELFEGLSLTEYSTKNFGMYGGEEETVVIDIKNDMIGVFFDRFGTDMMVVPIDGEHSRIKVKVAVSNQFLGWIIALGESVKITGPETVMKEMKAIGKRIAGEYK